MKYTKTQTIRSKPRAAKKSRIKRVIVAILLVILFFGVGSVAGLGATFYYFSLELPTIGPLLAGYHPPQTTRILASDGTVIGETFEERRTLVPIGSIPKVMTDAVIAAEDADFRKHKGLDYMGMARAMIANVRTGRFAQGASTITQQVARTFFLSREKKFSRKIKEMLLTKRIEEQLTKDEILYLYLNQINFGHARYGVGEAARFYFGKEIQNITLDEAALLAGIPKGPSIYEPIGHPKKALWRRSYVLGEMVKRKLITPAEGQLADSAPIKLSIKRRTDVSLAPEAVSKVFAELAQVVSSKELKNGGYTIETTIDPVLQKAARQAVQNGLAAIDKRHKRQAPYKMKKLRAKKNPPPHQLSEGRTYVATVKGFDDAKGILKMTLSDVPGQIRLGENNRYNPNNLKASEFAKPGTQIRVSLTQPYQKGKPLSLAVDMGAQGALVALDPSDGKIVALIGGYQLVPGGFNRAVNAKRQPGSAFKPIVFLEAIRTRRYTPASLLDDAPVVEGEWQPKDSHGNDYEGTVTLRDALSRSLNLPAIKLIRDVGEQNVVALARDLGIESTLEPGPALALGSSGVTPLELAAAYNTIAAKGIHHTPWLVKRVIDPRGREIPLLGKMGRQVVTPEEAYVVTSLLESVIKKGTGKKARSLKRAVAGKTGTTNDSKDAWFAGFSPDFTVVSWVGFDENRSLGRKEYGSRAALPIWIDFMKIAHADKIKRDFEPPEGIVTAQIDPQNSLLAYEGLETAVEEIFIEGTVPTETSLPPDTLSLNDYLLEQAAGGAGNVLMPGTVEGIGVGDSVGIVGGDTPTEGQNDAGVKPLSPEQLKRSLQELLDRSKRLD